MNFNIWYVAWSLFCQALGHCNQDYLTVQATFLLKKQRWKIMGWQEKGQEERVFKCGIRRKCIREKQGPSEWENLMFSFPRIICGAAGSQPAGENVNLDPSGWRLPLFGAALSLHPRSQSHLPPFIQAPQLLSLSVKGGGGAEEERGCTHILPFDA